MHFFASLGERYLHTLYWMNLRRFIDGTLGSNSRDYPASASHWAERCCRSAKHWSCPAFPGAEWSYTADDLCRMAQVEKHRLDNQCSAANEQVRCSTQKATTYIRKKAWPAPSNPINFNWLQKMKRHLLFLVEVLIIVYATLLADLYADRQSSDWGWYEGLLVTGLFFDGQVSRVWLFVRQYVESRVATCDVCDLAHGSILIFDF